MVRLGAEGMCVKWALFVCLLATLPARSLLVPLEAAFQGRCDDGNPCDQTCFNLHDNMYECDCTEGFYLNSNGYNCIKFNSTGVVAAGSVGPTQSSIAIQIEVDIEPPVGEEEPVHLSWPGLVCPPTMFTTGPVNPRELNCWLQRIYRSRTR